MTRLELGAVIGGLAPAIREFIGASVQAVADRLATLEAKHAAAMDQDPTIAVLLARVAVLEARPVGEKGEKGDPGTAGLTYQGVYQDGKTYTKGDVVTWAGQMYHCHKDDTTAKPEDFSRDWQLCVKRGRDGKDAK